MSSEPKLFGVWSTFPWHLRKHSAFLALHFGSIGLFVLLLLGYSALSVWPLSNTLRANNYRPDFTVIDPTTVTTCESQAKPYQVLPTLYGSHDALASHSGSCQVQQHCTSMRLIAHMRLQPN